MSDFKKLWGAPAPEMPKKVYDNIPDGVYAATVSEAAIDLAKDSVSLTYTVTTDGAYKNRKLFGNYILSEKGIYFLKQAMLMLGADETKVEALTSHDDLQGLLNTLCGKGCDVSVKGRTYTKNDGSTGHSYNVYVNEAASLKSSAPAMQSPKLDSGDSLPF